MIILFMHIGPYATEPATVAKMKAFAEKHALEERHECEAREGGYAVVYDHHEIYLSDPRRANPEKMQTILRHPVKKVI